MATKKKEDGRVLGRGLDIGTAFFVVAGKDANGKTFTKSIRDAFAELGKEAAKKLRFGKVSFIEKEKSVLIVGEEALHVANIFKEFELKRPLSKGLISPDETYAQDVVRLIIKELLGEPASEKETCCFSVPCNPVDADDDRDVIYHQAVFSRFISEAGYRPIPVNEAMAIVYSELADDDYTGIALSYGAGQTNCCLAYRTIEGLKFSVARGGDWIDHKSAAAVGSKSSRMCKVKERDGFDLLDPSVGDPQQFRLREAIQVHYKSLILYTLDMIAREFRKVQDQIELPGPIPIVVSGGTTLANGFIDLFRVALDEVRERKGFPIEISEVRHAREPLAAVAKGLLVLAMNEEEEEE